MTHSFNIEIAKKYGVEEAVVLHNIAFWIKHNKANNKNFFDSHYWTFNSAKALEELFPYFNAKKISRLLLKLEDKKIIKSGNYNKISYDRTKWYTIIDLEVISIYEIAPQSEESSISQKCPMERTEVSNRVVESVRPIPDINKDINTDCFSDIKNTDDIDDIKKQENNQSVEFKNDLNILKDIVEKSTGVARQYVDSKINPANYKNKFDLKTLIEKINESDFLLGKLDTKPNLNNFSMYKMLELIMADTYKNKELCRPKTKKVKKRVMNKNFEWVIIEVEEPLYYNN